MEKVRFGIIGVGGMGGHHAKTFRANGVANATLTAVCDTDPAKLVPFAEDAGIKRFDKYQALLDSGLVDAVLIATPHYDHPIIATAAFAKGLHVLSEKPVAVTVGAARKLNETRAKYPNLKFGIMFQMRTSGYNQKLRELVQSGDLGEISRITWICTDWFRTWTYYASGGWRATWAGEGGGVLLNQCPHSFDLLQWIPNMIPSRVTAVGSVGKTHPIEVEDEMSAILEYPNGAIGHFITSSGEAPGTNRMEICGDQGRIVAEKGKIIFSRTRKSVKQVRETSPESFPHVETWDIEIPFSKRPDGHQVVTQAFVDAILKGTPLVADGEEGVKGLEISNAIMLSGLKRRPVELPMDAEEYERLIKENIATYGGRKTLGARQAKVDMGASFKMQ